jgi:hypothetical protein
MKKPEFFLKKQKAARCPGYSKSECSSVKEVLPYFCAILPLKRVIYPEWPALALCNQIK